MPILNRAVEISFVNSDDQNGYHGFNSVILFSSTWGKSLPHVSLFEMVHPSRFERETSAFGGQLHLISPRCERSHKPLIINLLVGLIYGQDVGTSSRYPTKVQDWSDQSVTEKAPRGGFSKRHDIDTPSQKYGTFFNLVAFPVVYETTNIDYRLHINSNRTARYHTHFQTKVDRRQWREADLRCNCLNWVCPDVKRTFIMGERSVGYF